MDLPEFFGRSLVRSPWFWMGCAGCASVAVIAVVIALRRNSFFPGLYLLLAAVFLIAHFVGTVNAYQELRAPYINWSECDSNASLRAVGEHTVRSIERGTYLSIMAPLFAMLGTSLRG